MKVIRTVAEYAQFVAQLADHTGPLFLDTETVRNPTIEGSSGLDPYTNHLALLQIRFGGETYVVDFLRIPIEELTLIKPYLEHRSAPIVCHNVVFDWKQMFHHGKIEMSPLHCTMVTEQVLKSGLIQSGFGLDDVADRRLHITLDKSIRDKFINFAGGDLSDDMLFYGAEDVDVLEPIYYQQIKEIPENDLTRVYDLECSLLHITSLMEYAGICVDKPQLEAAAPVIDTLLARIDKLIQDDVISAGIADQIVFDRDGYVAVNTGSPKQMLQVMRAFGVKVKSLGKKELSDWDGQWAKKHGNKAVEDVAEGDEDMHIGYAHPLLRKHAIRTAAAKIQGTYIEGLLTKINPVTQRIHPGYKQCGAASTGRFSSVAPNFQNIPNKDKLTDIGLGAYDIRSMFIPAEGCSFIICDYSGIELSILAIMSGDKNLIYEITQGDIHAFVANSLEGDRIAAALGHLITPETKKIPEVNFVRNRFKTVSFGIVYGSTGYNLYRSLYFPLSTAGIHITQEDCDRWVVDWKAKLFPQTGALLEQNSHHAVTRMYTESVLGRKRRWPMEIRQDKWRMFAAMREGMNQPIQASSADITKLAMVLLHKQLDPREARIAACVHDELLVETRFGYEETAKHLTKQCMEEAGRILFPDADPALITAQPKVSNRYDK